MSFVTIIRFLCFAGVLAIWLSGWSEGNMSEAWAAASAGIAMWVIVECIAYSISVAQKNGDI